MYDSAINHRASRPVPNGAALDAAIDEARAELAALLRAPGGGEPNRLTEARALLGSLLDRRVGLAAARLDDRDAFAVAAARRAGFVRGLGHDAPDGETDPGGDDDGWLHAGDRLLRP
jgi:hypothetical protein